MSDWADEKAKAIQREAHDGASPRTGLQLTAQALREARAEAERESRIKDDVLRYQAAQLAGMREAPQCSGSGDICKIRSDMKCRACRIKEVPASEWEKRVQGLVEAVKYLHNNGHWCRIQEVTSKAIAAWEGKS